MVKVVFAHGWGFDKSIWYKTINRLNIDRPILLDFGYTFSSFFSSLPCCSLANSYNDFTFGFPVFTSVVELV